METMRYPLREKIGAPELLVGREDIFRDFDRWINNIPRLLSGSRAILGRRKSGKTVFVQRIFNQLWSANGAVIPFYLDISEDKRWTPEFAIDYYCAFASQYISFIERDERLIRQPLTLAEIIDYGKRKPNDVLRKDAETMLYYKAESLYGLLWKIACHAPHRTADVYDQRILVILDEFQNITQYIYHTPAMTDEPDETMAGSVHSLLESKVAPMLVTGSYMGWLQTIISKYFEGGRLHQFNFSPYLTPEEGLEAVYKYAEYYQTPITNETALQINELCMADPFFISCVVNNRSADRDLTTAAGVIHAVTYEISSRQSQLVQTWGEYIELTLQRINDRYAKAILLHLNKHSDRYWTPKEIKEALHLDLEVNDIHRKLLILLLHANRRLQGMLNHVSGKFAEHQLANEFRSRKRFRLSDYFTGVVDDRELNIVNVRDRVTFQRDGGNKEIDVLAQSSDSRVLLVEVRKRLEKSNRKDVEDFREKVAAYVQCFPDQTPLLAFLSLGGFTEEARQYCTQHQIGTAEQIVYLWNV